jgi:Skp family chaperone for outer membrane proteins
VIDEARVRRATAEWQTIEAEGVRRGSARYMLLMSDMDRRIRNAVHKAAADASKDLVVRQGDVSDRKGRPVVDLTDEVIARL